MPTWQQCYIGVREIARDRDGFLRRGYLIQRWVAIMETTYGQEIIDQSPECKLNDWDPNKRSEERRFNEEQQTFQDERSKLVARLMNNGWEPMEGQWYKRQVS